MKLQPVAEQDIDMLDSTIEQDRTFFGRHACLVRRARSEETGYGDQEILAADVPQIGRRSHERLPAAMKKRANKGEIRGFVELGRPDGSEGVRVRRRGTGGDLQEVEVAEGVSLGLELREEGDEGGGVGAQGVAVRLLEEAVEVRQLLRGAGEALDVRHQGLRRLHHCRRGRRRARLRRRRRSEGFCPRLRRRSASLWVSGFGLRLRCGESPGPGLWGLWVWGRGEA